MWVCDFCMSTWFQSKRNSKWNTAREADTWGLGDNDAAPPGTGNLTILGNLHSTKLLVKGLNQSCCNLNFWLLKVWAGLKIKSSPCLLGHIPGLLRDYLYEKSSIYRARGSRWGMRRGEVKRNFRYWVWELNSKGQAPLINVWVPWEIFVSRAQCVSKCKKTVSGKIHWELA